jgi:hypothetical protein
MMVDKRFIRIMKSFSGNRFSCFCEGVSVAVLILLSCNESYNVQCTKYNIILYIYYNITFKYSTINQLTSLDTFELGDINSKPATTGLQSSVAKNHQTFAARNFFVLIKSMKFDVPSGSFVLFIDVALFNSGVVVLQRSLGGRGTNIFGQWDKGTMEQGNVSQIRKMQLCI